MTDHYCTRCRAVGGLGRAHEPVKEPNRWHKGANPVWWCEDCLKIVRRISERSNANRYEAVLFSPAPRGTTLVIPGRPLTQEDIEGVYRHVKRNFDERMQLRFNRRPYDEDVLFVSPTVYKQLVEALTFSERLTSDPKV